MTGALCIPNGRCSAPYGVGTRAALSGDIAEESGRNTRYTSSLSPFTIPNSSRASRSCTAGFVITSRFTNVSESVTRRSESIASFVSAMRAFTVSKSRVPYSPASMANHATSAQKVSFAATRSGRRFRGGSLSVTGFRGATTYRP